MDFPNKPDLARPAGQAMPEKSLPAVAAGGRTIGIFYGFLVVFFFCSFTLVSRLGFSSSLTLPDLAALRFGIGGTLLLPVLLRHGLSGLRWRDAAALAFLGGLGFALFAYTGFSLAPAAHGAALVHGTQLLFTCILVGLTSRSWPAPRRAVGIAVIGAGILVLAYSSVSSASLRQLAGDGCLLLGSLCWSGYGFVARRLDVAPARAAAVVVVFSMGCFLPVYLVLPGKALFLVNTKELLIQGLFQGVLNGTVSIFVYTRAVAALGPTEMGFFTAAVPCVTTLAAIPLLAEFPSPVVLVGVGVVTLGMIVALRRPPRKPPPTVSGRKDAPGSPPLSFARGSGGKRSRNIPAARAWSL